MTQEKRIEAVTWLIKQAEAVQDSIVGLDFDSEITVCGCAVKPERQLWGDGFYELARAASQVVHTEVFDATHDKEYFNFDGVQFFRLKSK